MPWIGGPLGARVPLDLGPGSLYPYVTGDTPASGPVLDSFSFTAVSRGTLNYASARSQVASAFDNDIGTFASVAQSRPVLNYTPPRAITAQAFDSNLSTFAPFTQSRPVLNYLPPRSLTVSAYDQPAVTFGTDWANVALSRPVLNYRAPLSLIVNAYPGPPDNWAATALSRPTLNYRAPLSTTWQAYAPPPSDIWASVAVSTILGRAPSRQSTVWVALDQSTGAFAPTALSRPLPAALVSRSLISLVADSPAVASDGFACVITSRPTPAGVRLLSVTVMAADQLVVNDAGGGGHFFDTFGGVPFGEALKDPFSLKAPRPQGRPLVDPFKNPFRPRKGGK